MVAQEAFSVLKESEFYEKNVIDLLSFLNYFEDTSRDVLIDEKNNKSKLPY